MTTVFEYRVLAIVSAFDRMGKTYFPVQGCPPDCEVVCYPLVKNNKNLGVDTPSTILVYKRYKDILSCVNQRDAIGFVACDRRSMCRGLQRPKVRKGTMLFVSVPFCSLLNKTPPLNIQFTMDFYTLLTELSEKETTNLMRCKLTKIFIQDLILNTTNANEVKNLHPVRLVQIGLDPPTEKIVFSYTNMDEPRIYEVDWKDISGIYYGANLTPKPQEPKRFLPQYVGAHVHTQNAHPPLFSNRFTMDTYTLHTEPKQCDDFATIDQAVKRAEGNAFSQPAREQIEDFEYDQVSKALERVETRRDRKETREQKRLTAKEERFQARNKGVHLPISNAEWRKRQAKKQKDQRLQKDRDEITKHYQLKQERIKEKRSFKAIQECDEMTWLNEKLTDSWEDEIGDFVEFVDLERLNEKVDDYLDAWKEGIVLKKRLREMQEMRDEIEFEHYFPQQVPTYRELVIPNGGDDIPINPIVHSTTLRPPEFVGDVDQKFSLGKFMYAIFYEDGRKLSVDEAFVITEMMLEGVVKENVIPSFVGSYPLYGILNDAYSPKWEEFPHSVRAHFFTQFLIADPRAKTLDRGTLERVGQHYLFSSIRDPVVPNSSMVECCTNFSGYLAKYLGDLLSSNVKIPKILNDWVAQMAMKAIKQSGANIYNSITEAIMSTIKTALGEVYDNFKAFFIALLGMAFRCMMGYTHTMLISELCLAGISLFGFDMTIVDQLHSLVKPNGVEESLPLVLSVFMYGIQKVFGIPVANFTNFLNLLRTSQFLLPKDPKAMLAHTPFIGTFFAEDIKTMMESAYPCTVTWRDLNADFAARDPGRKPKMYEIRRMKLAYASFVRERVTMTPNAYAYWQKHSAELTPPKEITSGVQPYRLQPPCWCFHGQPGVGKTKFVEMICDALYEHAIEKEYIDADVLREDFYYAKSPATKHFDSYKGQPIFGMNDFLSSKEVAGQEGACATLMGIVDCSPYVLPMASIEDKGVYADPMFVFLTTNLHMNNWSTHAKSLNNPEAMVRRVSRYFCANARKYDSRRQQMIPVPEYGPDQYIFGEIENKQKLDVVTSIHDVYDLRAKAIADLDDYMSRLVEGSGPTTKLGLREGSPIPLPLHVGRKFRGYHLSHALDLEQKKNFSRKIKVMDEELAAKQKKTIKVATTESSRFDSFGKPVSAPVDEKEEDDLEVEFDDPAPETLPIDDVVPQGANTSAGSSGDDEIEMDAFEFNYEDTLEDDAFWEDNEFGEDAKWPKWSEIWKQPMQKTFNSTADSMVQMWNRHKLLSFFGMNFIISLSSKTQVTRDDLFVKTRATLYDVTCEHIVPSWSCYNCVRAAASSHPYLDTNSFHSRGNVWAPRFSSESAVFDAYPQLSEDLEPTAMISISRCFGVALLILGVVGAYKLYPYAKKGIETASRDRLLKKVWEEEMDKADDREKSEPVITSSEYIVIRDTGASYHRVATKSGVAYVPAALPTAVVPTMVSGKKEWKLGNHTYKLGHNDWYYRDDIDPQAVSYDAIKKAQAKINDGTMVNQLFGAAKMRLDEQYDGILNSIVRVFINMKYMGHGFLVEERFLAIPRHYHLSNQDLRLVTYKGAIYEFKRGRLDDYSIFDKTNRDVMLVRLNSKPVKSANRHFTKFPMSPCPLNTVVKRLDFEGVYSKPGFVGLPVTGTYQVDAHDIVCHRVESIPGGDGFCGLPYIIPSSGANTLAGIHVGEAAEKGGMSYYVPITQGFIREAKTALGDYNPPPKHNVKPQSAQKLFGVVDTEGESEEHHCPMTRKSKIAPVDGIAEDRDKFWKLEYGVAPLGHVVDEEGEKVPVEAIRFRKWARLLEKNRGREIGLSKRGASVLRKLFGPSRPREDYLPDFNTALRVDHEAGIKSVDRGKSAGVEFPSASKWIMFDPDEVEPTLTEDAYNMLLDIERRMMEGEAPSFLKGVALKDEKLPLEKIALGKTRLFAPDSIFLYILSRKYFHSMLGFFNKRGPHAGIAAAMSPDTLGQFLRGKPAEGDWSAFGADGVGMEATHTYNTWIQLFRFAMDLGIFQNEGRLYNVDPNLPPLNATNRIRWMLIEQMAYGWWLYRNHIFSLPGMLPSGCLLTWIVNNFAGLMIKSEVIVHYVDQGRLRMDSCHEDYKKCFRGVFFGDDEYIKLNPQFKNIAESSAFISVWQYCATQLGYTLTIEGKDGKSTLPETVSFCGRRFVRHSHGVTAALERKRIVKIVQFSKKSDFLQNYPQQVSTYVQEAMKHNKNMYKSFITNLRIGDNKLLPYCPWLKNYRHVHAHWDDENYDLKLRTAVVEWIQDLGSAATTAKVLNETIDRYHDDVAVVRDNIVPQSAQGSSDVSGQDEAGLVIHGEELAVLDLDEEPTSVVEMKEQQEFLEESFFVDPLNKYFERPTQLATIEWTSGHTRGHELASFPMPSTYFTLDANPQMKLAQTVGLYTEVEVTIVMTSVPTQAGALILTGSPMARNPGDVYQMYSGPHTLIKAGSHKTCRMRFPFVRDSNYCQSAYFDSSEERRLFDFLNVKLNVLSPLLGAASTSCLLQIWLSLKNPQVMQGGLTDYAIIPQGKNGMVSEAIHHTAGAVGQTGPGIKTIAGTIDSVSCMAKVMPEMVGCSKPTMANNMTWVKDQSGMFMANVDGVDTSQSASLYPDCRALPPAQVGGDLEADPMDVNVVCSREGLAGFIPYSENSTGILWRCPAVPGLIPSAYDITSGVPLPMGFACSFASWWRATIFFRLTLVKTTFHGGTLEVSVNFGKTDSAPDTDGAAARLHRVVWDIANEDEKVFQIPYVSPFHYRPFEWYVVDSSVGGPNIFVRALTKLVSASEVVDTEIEIIVSAWAEDVELAWPHAHLTEEEVEPSIERMKSGGIFREEVKPNSAGAFDPANVPQVHVMAPGPTPKKIEPAELAARVVAGDRLVSFRQILKRFQFFRQVEEDTSVYNPENEQPLAEYHRLLTYGWVFGTGGIRVKMIRNSGSDLEARVFLLDQWVPGEPVLISTEPSRCLEITIPPVYPMSFYLLGADGGGGFRWPQLKVRPNEDCDVYTALADGATWSGVNYLPVINLRDSSYGETIRPAELILP